MKSISWIALMAVLLVACGRSVSAPVAGVTALPTQAITRTPVHTESITAPDGSIRASLVCFQSLMTWSCETRFPNGNILYGSPGKWSPDNRYAIVCATPELDVCTGFQVWDMIEGAVVYQFQSYYHQWSPYTDHQLIHLVENQMVSVPNDLIEFDPASRTEVILQQCPDWWLAQYDPQSCPASPGVIVGGKVIGSPQNAQAIIKTYALDEAGKLRGYQTVEMGGDSWMQLLRSSFGARFHITIEWSGYTGISSSYVLQLDTDQVLALQDGQFKPIRPDTLDFEFRNNSK